MTAVLTHPQAPGPWHFLPASALPALVGLSLEGQRFGEGKGHHLSRSIKTEQRFLSS